VRIVFILLLFPLLIANAGAYHLKVIAVDEEKGPKKLPDYKKTPKDSTEAVRIIKTIITGLHQQSYIIARIDTVFFKKDSATAYIFIGEKFNWVSLRKGNIDGYLLDRSGFKERFYRDKPFRYSEYNKLENAFIKLSENNGFPFASIRLDSLSFSDQGISASLNYQKGPFFTFDSINIVGKTKTKKRYLMRHIRLYKGQPFSQQRVDEAGRLLRELPFLTQTRPPEVIFAKNKATLTLFLADKKINQVDGIIGFLPGEGTNKKLLVTGELTLGLRNLFGTGKSLNVEWRKIKQASQTLDMYYIHPKLLGSSMDVKVDFNLLKQDSTFITILRKLTFTQRAGAYAKVSVIGGLKTSRILGGVYDTSSAKYADYNYYTYGLGYDRNNLDNIFYPRRGWLFSAQGYLGNKSIHTNPDFNPSYYSDVRLKSVQFNLEGSMEKYTKLGKGSVLLTRISAGSIFNDKNNLFFNDLYRIGGLKTLRGFNQNNFYASSYTVATLEYRFFTDETSYLLLFYDQGYLINELSPTSKVDYPKGFGAGVSFTTPAGIFNFVYSLGSSNDQKVSLNLSKIHFGITSRF
jgi:translocation and assembly module TamA